MNVTFQKRKKANSNDITILIAIRSKKANINIRKATKATINKNDWSNKNARPKAIGKNKQINTYLDTIKNEIENYILEYEKLNKHEVTESELKKHINNLLSNNKKEKISNLIIEFFKDDSLTKNEDNTNTTKRRHINIFCNAVKDCTAKQLSVNKLEDYSKELTGLDLQLTTLNTHLKNVRHFLKFLYDDNYIKEKLHRNKFVKDFKTNNKSIISLNLKERETILNAEFENEKETNVLDLFKLNCLIGVRYEDLRHVKRENIEDNVLEIRINKTRNLVKIPLTKLAIQILEKHRYKIIIYTNQEANRTLKTIFERLEFDRLINLTIEKIDEHYDYKEELYKNASFKLARKTFITTALLNDMSIEEIKLITGHSSNEIYKYTANNTKDLANKLEKIDEEKDKEIQTLESKVLELESKLKQYEAN